MPKFSFLAESLVFMSVIQAGEVSMQELRVSQDNTGLTWLNVGGKPSITLVIMICMFACFVHKKQLPPVTQWSQIQHFFRIFPFRRKRVLTDESHSDDHHVVSV